MTKIKHKKLIITLSVIAAVILAVIIGAAIYLNDYYRAGDSALSILKDGAEGIMIDKSGDNIIFKPDDPKAGLIFYPGGKVEYSAYTPLMTEFAKKEILCVLVKMPFNLAVLDINAADGITEQFPEVSEWYIGGHSLGGAMASSYLESHTEEFAGLMLLGAYSTADFSDTDLRVVTLYGSEDKVLNLEKYENAKINLPEDFSELIIDGGCHSYFGDYGSQEKDGSPTISREQQMEITADFFFSKINGL